jgi:prepilin signal peptidase PulO-like enzyme (type II secretory pathway)
MASLLLLIPLGLLLGVLIVYLADVLPYKRRISGPVCAYCGADMGWKPYLLFRPCPQCGKSRRNRNWLIPLLAAVWMGVFWFYSPLELPIELPYWLAVILLAYFALVVITDLEYHAVLTEVSIAGAALGLAAGLMRNSWLETLLGGAAGFGIMLLLYVFGRLFGRWLAKRRGVTLEDTEALGFGDVNLGGIIGLILGWPAVVAGLFLAIVLGGVTGLLLVLVNAVARRYKVGMFIPYAPFLVFALVLLLYLPW